MSRRLFQVVKSFGCGSDVLGEPDTLAEAWRLVIKDLINLHVQHPNCYPPIEEYPIQNDPSIFNIMKVPAESVRPGMTISIANTHKIHYYAESRSAFEFRDPVDFSNRLQRRASWDFNYEDTYYEESQLRLQEFNNQITVTRSRKRRQRYKNQHRCELLKRMFEC
jgi:hypothetical protein